MKKSHREIKREIIEFLSMFPEKFFVWNEETVGIWDAKRGCYRKINFAGKSDILGIVEGGRMLAIEVKSRGDKLRLNQKVFLEEIKKKGGLAIVAYDLMDVVKRLQEEGYLDVEII